jgi:hypothetical protein
MESSLEAEAMVLMASLAVELVRVLVSAADVVTAVLVEAGSTVLMAGSASPTTPAPTLPFAVADEDPTSDDVGELPVSVPDETVDSPMV